MRLLWQVSCRCTPLPPCFWENPSAKKGEGGWSRGQVFCAKCCSSHFWQDATVWSKRCTIMNLEGMRPGHSRDTSIFWLALPRLMSEWPHPASRTSSAKLLNTSILSLKENFCGKFPAAALHHCAWNLISPPLQKGRGHLITCTRCFRNPKNVVLCSMCTPSSHQLDPCRGGSTHQFFNSSSSGASSFKGESFRKQTLKWFFCDTFLAGAHHCPLVFERIPPQKRVRAADHVGKFFVWNAAHLTSDRTPQSDQNFQEPQECGSMFYVHP